MTDFRNRVIEAMASEIWGAFVREQADPHDWPTWGEILAQGHQGMHRVNQFREYALGALTALLSELDAAGWQIVPKEATAKMQEAGAEDENEWRRMPMPKVRMKLNWESMLAAALHPFPEDKS